MAPRSKPLSDAAKDVLRGGLVLDRGFDISTAGQLDRKLYVEVNDALERLGAKWDRKQRLHVFQTGPATFRGAVQAMLADGVAPPKNPLAYYETPPLVADRLVSKFDLRGDKPFLPSDIVLDPSCGRGNLLDAFIRHTQRTLNITPMQTYGIELDPARGEIAAQRRHAVWMGDFLGYSPGHQDIHVWIADYIVMNPPFAVPDQPNAWLDHVEHALRWLALGGQLAAIMPASVRFRDNNRIRLLRELAERTGGIEDLPDGTFSGSDTEVRTVMLWLTRR